MTERNIREVFDQARPDFPTGRPFWEDSSFREATKFHWVFQQIQYLLPGFLSDKIFPAQMHLETLSSSYADHGYGYFFYALTRVLKPELCVELGILEGFSLLHVAAALSENQLGHIEGFDLFEDYPFRHGFQNEINDQIHSVGLDDVVVLNQKDAFSVHTQFETVDLLHVDVSNDGSTFIKIFDLWDAKVQKAIVLEGGDRLRDRVDWMIEFERPPIHPILEKLRVDHPDWTIHVLEPFPSLTVALRKE